MTTKQEEWCERFDEKFHIDDGGDYSRIGCRTHSFKTACVPECLKAFIRAEKEKSRLDGLTEGQNWNKETHEYIRRIAQAETLQKVLEVVRELLEALGGMYEQYCGEKGHWFMSAGERASLVLEHWGALNPDGAGRGDINWELIERPSDLTDKLTHITRE